MRERFIANGRWYYTLTICTAGLLAWVPFLHGGSVTHDPLQRRRAFQYGALAVVVAVLSAVMPTDEAGDPVGAAGTALSTIAGGIALVVIVGACIQLRPLRSRVYGLEDPHRVPASASDVAVEDALAARKRREEARALVERDPGLARDLNIGRPDRHGQYDDGGLIDLNSAPAEWLMSVCGLSQTAAHQLVEVRQRFPNGFAFVDEAVAFVDLSERDEKMLRDRAIVVPS